MGNIQALGTSGDPVRTNPTGTTTLATQNPVTDMWITSLEWYEK